MQCRVCDGTARVYSRARFFDIHQSHQLGVTQPFQGNTAIPKGIPHLSTPTGPLNAFCARPCPASPIHLPTDLAIDRPAIVAGSSEHARRRRCGRQGGRVSRESDPNAPYSFIGFTGDDGVRGPPRRSLPRAVQSRSTGPRSASHRRLGCPPGRQAGLCPEVVGRVRNRTRRNGGGGIRHVHATRATGASRGAPWRGWRRG
ncbi:hypothetical protein LX32DRAFT_28773 [Colletotrichum zoysiae]|uniref:Uncharacterized protein n=1 Tax=Colletotrichum zoysiae TaxID=1216348 RepID=A0AAD9M1Y5_9PEZI|nr:hypothetical protein LX32DRAFT_28773 [Colletotrichum zoysiae]